MAKYEPDYSSDESEGSYEEARSDLAARTNGAGGIEYQEPVDNDE